MHNVIGKKVRLTCVSTGLQAAAKCVGATETGLLVQPCQQDIAAFSNLVLLEVFADSTETITKARANYLGGATLAVEPFGPVVTRQRNMDLEFLNEPVTARLPRRETLIVTAVAPDGFAFEAPKIVIDKGGCTLTMELVDRDFELPFTVEMQALVGKTNFGSARLGEIERVPKMYWDKLRRVG